ncbi:MAG: cupin domain-containing protein [Steroidobacteraceae bacterium]
MASVAVRKFCAAELGAGEEYFLPAEKLLQGNPRQTLWLQYTDPSGQFMAGIWHSERGRWKVLYTEEEFCQVLEGLSVITDQTGIPLTVGAGDEFVIPRRIQRHLGGRGANAQALRDLRVGTAPIAGNLHRSPALAQLAGMWRRSLLIAADGTRDTTTQVRWLQAQSIFVDLRQGSALPDFLHLRCLRDLTLEDCAQLAMQEGFAGRLGFDGGCFEWLRLIDFQPRRAVADAGRLWWEDQVLIETGRDLPYVEHWTHDPTVVTRPLAALYLRDPAAGVTALAVQAGTIFMFARSRQIEVAIGATLADCVAAAGSVAQAQLMLDCEISLGSAGFGANVILASTHPWRVGQCFELACADSTAQSVEVDPGGLAVTRRWEVIESEGDPRGVWPGP